MMRHLISALMVLTAVLAFSPDASASEITSMEMDVEINADGSVNVMETREANMTEGTENYIVFNEEAMDGIEVSNFSVEGFTEQTDWDPDAS